SASTWGSCGARSVDPGPWLRCRPVAAPLDRDPAAAAPTVARRVAPGVPTTDVPPLADGFPYVEDFIAPGDPASPHHVLNYEVQRLLAESWYHFLATAFDGDADRAFALRPLVREVLTG